MEDYAAEQGGQGSTETPDVENKDDAKEASASRKALVSQWQSRIKKAKAYWEKDFKRMREDMQLAYAGADKEWIDADSFVVPIISRHINQTVATLYAKNPRIMAEPKRRIENILWDGRKDSLDAALMALQSAVTPQVDPATGMPMPSAPVDPMALQIVQEVEQIQQRRLMLKKICKTLEILLEYFFGEQEPSFKVQLKQLVRRTKTCGVGYVYLGYQRLLEKQPEICSRLEDITAQLARLEMLMKEKAEGELTDDSAQMEELRLLADTLAQQTEVITREGPVFDFPRSTEIIHDTKNLQINGMIGSTWFAREFHMDCDEVKETFKIDVGTEFTAYNRKVSPSGAEEWTEDASDTRNDESVMCVWKVWDKKDGQTFVLIDGYCDFVEEPAAPPVKLERFWPLFTLTFNDVEHETKRFPLSDARMLRHTQLEYNRSRQIRRLHRISNTPKYIVMAGKMTKEDKEKLATAAPFSVIEVAAIMDGQDVGSLIQQLKTAPLDPALYETNTEMEDVYRTVGVQEATLGGTSNATATEVSVGEESRTTSSGSNIDDLDTLLSQLFRATGQMLLMQLDITTVKKIVGPGAVWPQLSREEIVSEVMIDIKAGSSGKPNAAAELAKIERAVPFLIQFDNVSTKPIAEKYASLLDIEIEDLIVDGLPSQTALNAMASKLTSGMGASGAMAPAPGGASSVDPTAQGAQGGNNTPSAPAQEPGAQPAYPTPSL